MAAGTKSLINPVLPLGVVIFDQVAECRVPLLADVAGSRGTRPQIIDRPCQLSVAGDISHPK